MPAWTALTFAAFQPTLPARGATRTKAVLVNARPKFQPTLPARGATPEYQSVHGCDAISTHAPRTGSDSPVRSRIQAHRHFNPRSPHGERRKLPRNPPMPLNFNPRSPHGERRERIRQRRGGTQDFNPRSPHGERPMALCCVLRHNENFNPRSPHGERRVRPFPGGLAQIHFNPRSPHGERRTFQI